jgi:UDP-N-acetylmuramyl pentapeptide synthase
MSRGDDGHITLIINGEEIETGSANQTFSMNLLAASAVASTLGMSWEVIQERVASFQAVTGRCRVEVKNGVTVIDDTYNANLTSTLAALDYLFDIPSEGERHFIFGDMLELGDASESHHQKVGVAASEKRVDHFYCYGAEAATASTAANGIDSRHFDGKKHLAEVIRENVSPGDVVLFKGSRGMALESVIEELFGD